MNEKNISVTIRIDDFIMHNETKATPDDFENIDCLVMAMAEQIVMNYQAKASTTPIDARREGELNAIADLVIAEDDALPDPVFGRKRPPTAFQRSMRALPKHERILFQSIVIGKIAKKSGMVKR